jgi:hypothetical protein
MFLKRALSIAPILLLAPPASRKADACTACGWTSVSYYYETYNPDNDCDYYGIETDYYYCGYYEYSGYTPEGMFCAG